MQSWQGLPRHSSQIGYKSFFDCYYFLPVCVGHSLTPSMVKRDQSVFFKMHSVAQYSALILFSGEWHASSSLTRGRLSILLRDQPNNTYLRGIQAVMITSTERQTVSFAEKSRLGTQICPIYGARAKWPSHAALIRPKSARDKKTSSIEHLLRLFSPSTLIIWGFWRHKEDQDRVMPFALIGLLSTDTRGFTFS